MSAGLAELHAEALDLADAEALANEAVDIDIAHGHLPSSLARPQLDILDILGCDKCQCLSGWGTLVMEMTVTFEPLPGDSAYLLHSPKCGLALSPEMNRLHRHGRIITHAPLASPVFIADSLGVICVRDLPDAATPQLVLDLVRKEMLADEGRIKR